MTLSSIVTSVLGDKTAQICQVVITSSVRYNSRNVNVNKSKKI